MEKDKKKIIDRVVEIILIIVIILLLIHNCALIKKNNEYKNNNGNDREPDVIEINCDHNGCKPISNEVKSLAFAEENISIQKGDTINLAVIIKPSGLAPSSKLSWRSSNPNIVTVDENGRITGVGIGQAVITVTSENGKTSTCTVNVTANSVAVKEIVLTPLEQTISTGEVTQIIAEVKPENATNRNLIWKSSNNDVATVDQNGVVTAVSNGTVTITAETEDGKVVASVTLTINENEEVGDLEVYDDEHTPVTWNGASDLKIFGTSGKVAPESSGTYQFIVKNTTGYNLTYNIDFIETNPYNMNMKYKLKKNDTYIIDHYVSSSELSISDLLLNSNQNDNYSLEWKWVSSDNDTQIGKTANANYELKIEIKAESTNG